ncbi:MAG: hypothetical protein R6U88_03145 [Candidatus Bipolaricaulota bacterium]
MELDGWGVMAMGADRGGRGSIRPVTLIALLALAAMLAGCAFLGPGVAPLEPPDTVSASQGDYDDRVAVSWSEVANASSYELERADAEDGDYQRITETSDTGHADTDVVRGETYWYCVRACHSGTCSAFTDPVEGYTELEPGPENLRASHGELADRIVVRWDSKTGADEYQLEIRDASDRKVGDLRVVEGDTTIYYHVYTHEEPMGEPRPGEYYTYRVRAIGEDYGTTAWSAPAQGRRHGRPAAPVVDEEPEVSVETVEGDEEGEEEEVWTVTLEWTWTWQPAQNPNPAQGFYIFRRNLDEDTAYQEHAIYDGAGEDDYDPDELPYEPEGDDPIRETYTFVWEDDEDVEEGVTYRYDVRAYHDEWFMRSDFVEVVIEED